MARRQQSDALKGAVVRSIYEDDDDADNGEEEEEANDGEESDMDFDALDVQPPVGGRSVGRGGGGGRGGRAGRSSQLHQYRRTSVSKPG